MKAIRVPRPARGWRCGKCGVLLSTRCGAEEHCEPKHPFIKLKPKESENDNLEYPKPEPQKYESESLEKYGYKVETSEHISWRVEKKHYDNFNSISREKRQDILDLFNKGGISIKEVGEKLKVDSKVVGDVIYLNLQRGHTLRTDSL